MNNKQKEQSKNSDISKNSKNCGKECSPRDCNCSRDSKASKSSKER